LRPLGSIIPALLTPTLQLLLPYYIVWVLCRLDKLGCMWLQ